MLVSAEDIPVSVIKEVARRPEILSVIQKLYTEVDDRIAEKEASCYVCGKCCQFDTFGHHLYVTTLEAAYYIAMDNTPTPVIDDVCPHLLDGKCGARDRRPFACRVFYCNPKYQNWLGHLCKDYHAQLRALHDDFHIPYIYADWMIILRALSANQK